MNHRQPRTYPILGLFLANLLRYVAVAKFSELSAPLLEYKHDQLLPYNKPFEEAQYNKPFEEAQSDQHDNNHNHHWNPIVPLDEQQVTPHPEFVQNGDDEYYDKYSSDNYQIEPNFPNNDLQYAASDTKLVKRRLPSYYNLKHSATVPRYSSKRRTQTRRTTERNVRHKNGQRRKPYTTPSYYYDSYEEITRAPAFRPKRPTPSRYNRRTTTEFYDDYDQYYEPTTLLPRRQRPVLNKRKRRPVYDYYENSDEYDNSRETFTETLHVKAKQQITTEDAEDTTITPTATSDATQSTAPMNTTTPSSVNNTLNATFPYGNSSNNDNISITYAPPENDYLYPTFTGYGPSNGNENISITYGPPSRLDYLPPYPNWYTPQIKPQDVVRTIHDIVDFDVNTVNRRII